jgi:hypothetical protein
MKKTTQMKWDYDLLLSQIQNIDDPESRKQLAHYAALVRNHQLYEGEQWAADLYADKYFQLFQKALKA